MWISLFTLKCLEPRPSHPACTLCPGKGGFVGPQTSGWLGHWHHPGGCASRPCQARNSILSSSFVFFYTRVWIASRLLHDHCLSRTALLMGRSPHTFTSASLGKSLTWEKWIPTQSHKMTPIPAHWCYEGCQFTPAVAFFGEGNENRVTMADPGMVGMFMLLPMWCGCFMWWDGSQCATGPYSVFQLLQQLLLILWGQLLVRERRRDASITHPHGWDSLTCDISAARHTSLLYWKKNRPVKQDCLAINSCPPHNCLIL